MTILSTTMWPALVLLCSTALAEGTKAQDDEKPLSESLSEYLHKVFNEADTTKLFGQPPLVVAMIATGAMCLLAACCCCLCCLCAMRKDKKVLDFDITACEGEKPQKRRSAGEESTVYDTAELSNSEFVDVERSQVDAAEAELHTYITDLISDPVPLGGSSPDDATLSLYGTSMKSIGEHSIEQGPGGLSKEFSSRFGNQYNDNDSSRFSYRGSTRSMGLSSTRMMGRASSRRITAGSSRRGMISKKFSYRKEDSFFNMLAGLKEEPREDDDSASFASSAQKSLGSRTAESVPGHPVPVPPEPEPEPETEPEPEEMGPDGHRRYSFIRINL